MFYHGQESNSLPTSKIGDFLKKCKQIQEEDVKQKSQHFQFNFFTGKPSAPSSQASIGRKETGLTDTYEWHETPDFRVESKVRNENNFGQRDKQEAKEHQSGSHEQKTRSIFFGSQVTAADAMKNLLSHLRKPQVLR